MQHFKMFSMLFVGLFLASAAQARQYDGRCGELQQLYSSSSVETSRFAIQQMSHAGRV
jgi:hypothetical protein